MRIKNYLNKLSKEQLVAEICELESKFAAVHDYFLAKVSDTGEDELLLKYKKIIEDEFLPKRGFGKARLSVARRAVLDFKKICKTAESLSDIMLYYVEIGVAFTNEYGDIDEPFYISMEKMYEDAVKFIWINGLWDKFRERMENVVTNTDQIGWGFHDQVEYIFYEYQGRSGYEE